MFVAPIVEGHGEVAAVPVLLHRIFGGLLGGGPLRVNPPIRVKAGSFLNDRDYFARYVTLATAKAAQEDGVVLILLDCEDSCPATTGPELLARAHGVRNDVATIVALAYREYETWFLAAAASIAGIGGLPADLTPPANPEHIRGAKEWLGRQMDTPYDPLTHQLLLTRYFDLAAAAAGSRSFRRLRDRLIAFVTTRN